MRRSRQPGGSRQKAGEQPAPLIQKLETLGLILIVLLILAITISRSFHYIGWRAR
ncbi:MAG TPA: hypothetical protein VFB00_02460 [Terriglobales bacterium]|nr:hypothetical protein [Terriglobales bacterium]